MATETAAPGPASVQAEPPKVDAAVPNGEKSANSGPRKPRQKRPNYNEIHVKPLPLDVHPLPAFIPHNPLSIVRIAITLLSHSFRTPTSHKVVHNAYFSEDTQSIHVTDADSIRALWEQGFWGKGSLSRSEPQWLLAERRRRGIEAATASTQITQARREERKQFKLERAKAQREAIEQQLRQEGKLDADGTVSDLVDDGTVSESPKGTLYTSEAGDVVGPAGDSIVSAIDKSIADQAPTWGHDAAAAAADEITDIEHLQLTPEEAFYLTYVLGALDILDGNFVTGTSALPAWYLLRLYSAYALSPISDTALISLKKMYQYRSRLASKTAALPPALQIAPDNPFLLKYAVYHHFRSLGWVVRPGIKFAVDYLLYLRGPAFHHAEFGVHIVPSYSHPYWSETPERVEYRKSKEGRDWWWFHRVNRVQTAVMKTLVLVYVEVPPPWDSEAKQDALGVDIGAVLKRYTVREVVFKRWSPSRNRD
ncbi:tRNA-splicing endonuclease-like protein subunit Sen2 [Boeremia exigua]|uniref:tRNA-splicing endonuclease-like protein subunit Sen2 n=1 Tax=Boeremia exigua TaxID=749465 RepID=UPI001E8E7E0F|nr:tRNA-splicing endonuclease-like protein subunit Sen2 [Boeremia exigua]KAH6638738.1 tRNA-splicing endonuclease-like protein subunit Sen2 [Boeremia exigua]